jgi:hypothetical protein
VSFGLQGLKLLCQQGHCLHLCVHRISPTAPPDLHAPIEAAVRSHMPARLLNPAALLWVHRQVVFGQQHCTQRPLRMRTITCLHLLRLPCQHTLCVTYVGNKCCAAYEPQGYTGGPVCPAVLGALLQQLSICACEALRVHAATAAVTLCW